MCQRLQPYAPEAATLCGQVRLMEHRHSYRCHITLLSSHIGGTVRVRVRGRVRVRVRVRARARAATSRCSRRTSAVTLTLALNSIPSSNPTVTLILNPYP